MNTNYSNSNLNSSEEVYLSLVHSYINATREMLNGYMTFETGLTRAINSQIFRNFTRNSFSAPRTATTQPESVQTEPEVEPEVEPEPIVETPANLTRRETQLPNTPIRPTLRFRSNLSSNSSAPSSPFQIPTPVRLTNRLDTPDQERRESQQPFFVLPRRVGLQQQQQLYQQPESNSIVREQEDESLSQTGSQNITTPTSIPRPPFSSTFVRYRLPVPVGPPRRVSSTNANPNSSVSNPGTRGILEVPIISPDSSPPRRPLSPPPPPPPLISTSQRPSNPNWQQLRQERIQQQQQLNSLSLSPILPVEPTPLPPAPPPAQAPLTSATRLMLNLMDTPRLNDTLIYYTQIIDRDFTRSQRRQENSPLSYDTIQQQTKIIPYCTITNPLNDICPISQVQFDLIDSVMQINNCKHNFNPYSLLRWLDSNSTCPMCRNQINIDVYDHDDNDDDDDERTIHMYNNGREEEPYRSEDLRNYENHYDDGSEFSSVG